MTTRILLLLAAGALTTGIVQAQKIAVNKGLKLETQTSTKTTMEVMGQNIDNVSTITNSVEVKDVTAEGYLFSNTLKRMTIKGTVMGQDMSFDSDKKEDMDGQIGQGVKGQIGAEQEILVDKQGKVTSIKQGEDKQAGPDMASMMNMTGDLAKGQPYPVLIPLPPKGAKPGDSWIDSAGTAATIKTVTTYTLKSVSGDGAVLSFTGTLAKNGNIEQNGMEIKMDISGNVKGESTYDNASGILKTSTTTTDIKGTLEVMGQNAPIAATVTATITNKKL